MKRNQATREWSRLREGYLAKTAAAAAVISCSPVLSAFARSDTYVTEGNANDWPWTTFLKSLAGQLSGPVPMILGILGIVGAGLALFSGNHGGGTQKFIVLIFAISICLFAPNFILMIGDSAQYSAGLTIFP